MKTQFFTSDLKLACVLAFAGYKLTRTLSDIQGKQYLFENPGDIDLLVADYANNIQGVSDAKSLLEIFEEQLNAKPPAATVTMGSGTELLPANIATQEGHDWTTKDFNTAILLAYRGNELLNTRVENGRTEFAFAYDDKLTESVSLFNQGRLRVEPRAWAEAGFKVRDAMRKVKGIEPSQSKYKSPSTLERNAHRAQERQAKQQTQPFALMASGLSNAEAEGGIQ